MPPIPHVYRKPTHTDLYLNGLSHHHPSQRSAVLTSLFHRAKRIADEESLPQEINHLRTTFQRNGYGKKEIVMALKRTFQDQRVTEEFLAPEDRDKAKPIAKAALPYVSTISGKLSRILRKRNIETIHKPPEKLRSQLVKIKDRMGLKTSGVYHIPCECGDSYIGETGRTIETRISEHKRCIRLGYPEKSAVADHCIKHNHSIHFDETKILCKAKGYWDRLTKEAIEIRIANNKMNRDAGFNLSKSWNPMIKRIRKLRGGRTPKTDQ